MAEESQLPRIQEAVTVLQKMFDRQDSGVLHVKDTMDLQHIVRLALGTQFWSFLASLRRHHVEGNRDAFVEALTQLLSGPARALRLAYLDENVFYGFDKKQAEHSPEEYAELCWSCLLGADDWELDEWSELQSRVTVPMCAPEKLMQMHQWPLLRLWRDKRTRVSHGGGLMHIVCFLIGQQHGNPLELPKDRRHVTQLRGLQVHPVESALATNREERVYSQRSLFFGDVPARLTASVPQGALVGQPNGYEAGLPWQNSQCATAIELRRVVV